MLQATSSIAWRIRSLRGKLSFLRGYRAHAQQNKQDLSWLAFHKKRNVSLGSENIPFSFLSIHRIIQSAAENNILFIFDANNYQFIWIFTSSFSILTNSD